MIPGDASQVLEVLRDVLIDGMDQYDSLPDFRVQSADYIGERSERSERLISDENIIACNDAPNELRLTMRSGCEYVLTLERCHFEED